MLNKGNKGCWICCVSSLLTFHRRMTINDQHSYIRFICKHPYAPRTVLLWTVTWFPSKSIPWHFPPRTWGPRVLLGAQGRREMQSVSSEKIAWTQQTLRFFGKLVKQHERTWKNPYQRSSKTFSKSTLIACTRIMEEKLIIFLRSSLAARSVRFVFF